MAPIIPPLKSYFIVIVGFSLPDNEVVDEHTDIDLLVSDYFLAKRVLDGDAGYDNGADMVEDGGDKVLNFVRVGEKEATTAVVEIHIDT